MAPITKTTRTERTQMKILREEGYSFRYIAKRMNLPRSVSDAMNRMAILRTLLEEEGQKKLSTSDKKYLKVTSLRNRRKSSKELTKRSGKSNWQKSDLKRNKHKRLIWVQTHNTWTSVQ